MKPAAGPSILAAALIVALVWLGPARALADELPNDTNQIERLTPEQARKLAAEFPGVRVVIKGNYGTSFIEPSLPLNGLKSLDAQTAKALAEFKGCGLCLNGLTALDADAAKTLAEFKGNGFCTLSLNGLTTLDADTAKALGNIKINELHLDGLTALDADTAEALGDFKSNELHLEGLTTFPQKPPAEAGGMTRGDQR